MKLPLSIYVYAFIYRLLLKDNIWQVTAIANPTKRSLGTSLSVTKIAQARRLIHSIDIEIIFALRGMHLCSVKSFRYGPKRGCPISHLYSRGELFKNRYEANSKNGVVGSTGRNMPIIPNITDTIPKRASNFFIIKLVQNVN